MQLFFLQRGFTFIHGAAVSKDANGICICAPPRTGKTNLFLAMVMGKNKYRILSDEISIINKQGEVFPYPRSMSLQWHNIKLFPALINIITDSWLDRQKIKLRLSLPNRYSVTGVPESIIFKIMNKLFRHGDKAYNIHLADLGTIGHAAKITKFLFLSRMNKGNRVIISSIDNPDLLAIKLAANIAMEGVGYIRDIYLKSLLVFPDKRNDVIENSMEYQIKIIISALRNAQCYQVDVPEGIAFKEVLKEYGRLVA